VGWFPFYPLLARTLNVVGVDMRGMLLGVSWLALLAALVLIYALVRGRWGDRPATVTLIALLLFPGSFYFLAAFPYSVYLALAAAILLLLEKKRYAWLALPAAALTVTYPSGVVVGLPLLWVLLRRYRQLSRRDRLGLAAALAAMTAALALYFGYYWWRFDDFWLYPHFQAQSYFGHRPTFPLWTIARTLWHGPLDAAVPMTLLLVLASTVLFYTRRIPVTWQLLMFGILLFTPTAGTTDCYYRHVVVAFPLFVMMGLAADSRRRRYLLPLYAAACLFLTWAVYLPLFRAGKLM
jgi:hypothetical protein